MKRPFGIFNILSICIIAILTNSCKEKDCHKTGECPPENYRIKFGDVKDYLFAKPGSYWIYENSVTGLLDTQTCIEFTYDSFIVRGTEKYSGHITLEYDRMFRTISSSYNKVYYYEMTNANTPDDKQFNNNNVKLERISNMDIATNYPFIYPFHPGIVSGDGTALTKFVQLDSIMVLKGKPFQLVVQMDIDIDLLREKDCPDYSPTSYYWAKDVGLIKKDVKRYNYSWELIDYKIIK